jgi:putative ABC transport system permease protein
VNSLTMTIADRRREFGILRAVGGTRPQVRGAIWMEAACIAIVGVALGLALGALHLYVTLELTSRDYPGLRFDYMYPWSVALLLVPVILGAALGAAIGPGEACVRGALVEALEYE